MAVEAEVTESLDESMESTIRESLKEIQSRGGDDAKVLEEPEKVDAPVVEEPAKADRPRDETGKFTKAEKLTEKPGEQSPLQQQQEQPKDATQQEVAPPEVVEAFGTTIDLNRAPSSWKPAAKAVWAQLPEPVRAEVYRREGNYAESLKGIKDNADFGQTVRQAIDPYRAMIAAEGSTPDRAIAETMRTAALFRTGTDDQKLQAWIQIANQFNVPWQKAFPQQGQQTTEGQPQQQQPQVYRDPRVDQLEATWKQEQQRRVEEAQRISADATARFLSAKGADGQPAYPFVDNVLNDMAERVQTIRGQNPAISHEEALKQAYDAAVWANPETRAVMLSQQQAKQQLERDNLRKVEEAKRAKTANMPRRGALAATEATGTMEETIRDTYRQLTG